MENILEITNLNKSYHGNPALNNINLSIKAGEIHGLSGLTDPAKQP